MKTSFFRSGCLLLALAFGSAVSETKAQVVFDNLGNSNPFTPSVGWTIGNSTFEVALQFTAASGGLLDYAELRLWNVLGNSTVNVALLANSGGNTPGAVLETSFVVAPSTLSPTPVSHVEFSNSTLLSAGTVYWLAVSPGDTTSHSAWEYVGLPLGNMAFDSGQIGFADAWGTTTTNTQPGARIFAVPTAVPEPSTYGLIGSALLVGLVAFRRRVGR